MMRTLGLGGLGYVTAVLDLKPWVSRRDRGSSWICGRDLGLGCGRSAARGEDLGGGEGCRCEDARMGASAAVDLLRARMRARVL